MEIRDERAGDEDAIRRVYLGAFGGDLEARLVDLLRERSKAIVSLVAVESGDVVGHILFSPVTIDGAASARALGMAPVGVLPANQRAGEGTASTTNTASTTSSWCSNCASDRSNVSAVSCGMRRSLRKCE